MAWQDVHTPNASHQRVAASYRAPFDDEDAPPPPSGAAWDPSLLAECARHTEHISSIQALQLSPAFQRTMRSQRLGYETAVDHKLRVYKALRQVDPDGFSKLFSRQDIKQYDSQPASHLVLAAEYLLSAAATILLLALPLALPSYPLPARAGALTWLSLQLLAWAGSCASPWGWLLGVYDVAGPYQHPASAWRLALAGVLEAAFLLATAGLALVPSLGFQVFSTERQSVVRRLLGLTPMVEQVQPMPFAQLG